MSRNDTLRLLTEELANALVPLEEAVTAPERFAALLREMGWDFTGLGVPPPIVGLSALIADLRAALDEVLAGDPTPQALEELRATIRNLVNAVRDLATLPPGSFPAELEAAGFVDKFPSQLVQFLVVTHLQHNHPRVETLWRVLGIVRVELVPPAGDRPAYVARLLVPPDLADLLRDPGLVLERVYGWGTVDFKYQGVLEHVADLVTGFGLDVYLEELDPRLVGILEAGAVVPGEPIRWSLKVPLFIGEMAGAPVETGVGLFALPAQGAHLPGFSLLPYAEGELQGPVQLSERVSLVIEADADLTAGAGVVLRPDEPIEVLTELIPSADAGTAPPSGGRVRVRLEVGEAEGGPIVLLGAAGIARVEVGHISLTGIAEVGSTGGRELSVELNLQGAAFVVVPDEADSFVRSLLPPEGGAVRFDLAVGLSAVRGFYLRGSGGLQASVPVHMEVGGIVFEGVTISVIPAVEAVPVEVGASLRARVGPLTARVENVGLHLAFSFPDSGGNLGLLHMAPGFKPPTGMSLSIDGGGFKGGGFLAFEPENKRYTGVLELEFKESIALKAVGLITTELPGGAPGYSLLLIITSEFQPIQLGLGFTLNGVGGLLGLNRTARIDRLRTGIRDNTLGSILFPTDVIANANRIISDLREVFPPQADRFVFGPMAKLGWGSPTIITIDLGLVIEVPAPVQLAILGVLKGLIPDEKKKLLRLQVNFLGVVELDEQRLAFDASLYDSKLLSYPLSGDMALRLVWGNNLNFLLSVGGFHPAYEPPPLALPKLRRLTLQLTSGDNPRLTLETYLAVTSNTVQFGARVELYAKAGSFNVYGMLAFDVLFQFNPFYFVADIAAKLALRRRSSSIASITVSMTLEGTTPWRAKGTARLKLARFFTVKVRFDRTFGERRDTRLEDVAVLPLVRAALEDRHNWRPRLPAGSHLLVSVREAEGTEKRIVAHPVGVLEVSQKVVPLNVRIERFGHRMPSDGREFRIENIRVNGDAIGSSGLKESFAPAQYFEMSDAQKLSSKSFEKYDAGVALTGDEGLSSDSYAMREVEYELSYRDSQRDQLPPRALVKPDAAAFGAWASKGAVARSSLSFAKAGKSALTPGAVSVIQEGFGVVGMGDLSLVTENSIAASEAEAVALMGELVARDPALMGRIQVVPLFEAVRSAA